MLLPDSDAWILFAAVADHGSFRSAAAANAVSVPTVSKAITRLEQRLGIALFHRTSRKVALTLAGQGLVDHARGIAAATFAAEEAARSDAGLLTGPIRLTAPLSLGISCLGPPLADFAAAHPAVTFDLILSDAQCDLVGDAIDMALRIAEQDDSSLLTQIIAPVPMVVTASPAYLARHGTPLHPADLSRHRVLGYGHDRRDNPLRLVGPDGGRVSVQPTGPLFANNGEVMLAMLIAGQGVAVLPRFIVGGALDQGLLVPILDDWCPPDLALSLVTPPSRLRPQRVRLLAAFLIDRLKRAPQLTAGGGYSG